MTADITACPMIEPRDGACWVKCCDTPLPPRRRRWCSTDHSNLWGRNHTWSMVRRAAMRRDQWTCRTCGARPRTTPMEVNHIVPLGDGSHATASCRHHLNNVETLCRPCHRLVTNQQIKERTAS